MFIRIGDSLVRGEDICTIERWGVKSLMICDRNKVRLVSKVFETEEELSACLDKLEKDLSNHYNSDTHPLNLLPLSLLPDT